MCTPWIYSLSTCDPNLFSSVWLKKRKYAKARYQAMRDEDDPWKRRSEPRVHAYEMPEHQGDLGESSRSVPADRRALLTSEGSDTFVVPTLGYYDESPRATR